MFTRKESKWCAGAHCVEAAVLSFRLRGKTGQELVKIYADNAFSTQSLTTTWQTFSFNWPTDGLYYIDFTNDDGGSDVFFEIADQVACDVVHPSNWPAWNCGSQSENLRCDRVRSGILAWGGIYKIAVQTTVTFDQFIPSAAPGEAMGSGSDARQMVLHSARIIGGWIKDCNAPVIAERTIGHSPSASSKRWFVLCIHDSYLKLVELDVKSMDGTLFVHGGVAKYKGGYKGWTGDVGREANLVFEGMSETDVAESPSGRGYGVKDLTYWLRSGASSRRLSVAEGELLMV